MLTVLGDSAKLGTLNRNSDVMVEGLYPVFLIPIPEGATEVQIRHYARDEAHRALSTPRLLGPKR